MNLENLTVFLVSFACFTLQPTTRERKRDEASLYTYSHVDLVPCKISENAKKIRDKIHTKQTDLIAKCQTFENWNCYDDIKFVKSEILKQPKTFFLHKNSDSAQPRIQSPCECVTLFYILQNIRTSQRTSKWMQQPHYTTPQQLSVFTLMCSSSSLLYVCLFIRILYYTFVLVRWRQFVEINWPKNMFF